MNNEIRRLERQQDWKGGNVDVVSTGIQRFATKRNMYGTRFFLEVDTEKKTFTQYKSFMDFQEVSQKRLRELIDQLKENGYVEDDPYKKTNGAERRRIDKIRPRGRFVLPLLFRSDSESAFPRVPWRTHM